MPGARTTARWRTTYTSSGASEGQHAFIKYDVNASRAILRGIVYHYLLIRELAADQQHKVYRSVRVELPATRQSNLVENEIQARLPFKIMGRDSIARSSTQGVSPDDLIALEHCQPTL
jgi:hypothetical protein